MKKIVIGSILIIVILAVIMGCSPATPQPTQTPIPTPTLSPTSTPQPTATENPYCNPIDITDYSNAFSILWDRWTDQYNILINVPRLSMADQIIKLQDINREIGNLPVTKCTVKVYSLTMKAVNKVVDFFLAFMSNGKQNSALLDESSNLMKEIAAEANRLKACIPNCKP